MTQEEQLREQHQALNAALNSHDLEKSTSFLHPDFVAQGTDGHSYNRQAAVQQLVQYLKPSFNFQSRIEVEHVEVSGDSAKLRVRRTESGRLYDPGHLWAWLAIAALFAAMTVRAAFGDASRFPFHFWGDVVAGAGCSVFSLWWAFRRGLRSMRQTQRAEETWRSVDGRWLVAEERQLS